MSKLKISEEIKERQMESVFKKFIEKYTYMKVGNTFLSVYATINKCHLFPKAVLYFWGYDNSISISFNYTKPPKMFIDLINKFEREHKIKVEIRRDEDYVFGKPSLYYMKKGDFKIDLQKP